MKIPFIGWLNPANAVDPVCGMNVKIRKPPGGTFKYLETEYYFCGPGCNRAFQKEAELYLSGEKQIRM